jgi:L-cysteine/cystine lyase
MIARNEAGEPMQAGALRAQMPALVHKHYFNYGGQGPLPRASLEAITNAFSTIQELGPFAGPVWPFVSRTIDGLRQRLGSAAWLGVGPRRLAFTENVTSGCVLPLWGLPWQAGDQLLVSDAEHPGVVAACRELARRHGLELRFFPVADLRDRQEVTDAALLQRLERVLSPRTRLVVLSHLLWNTGQLLPIARVAALLREHPAHPWLLVDGAQSLGSIPLVEAAAAADIYACTGHKWCCGPEGLGVVALSDRLLAEANPTLIGWRSLADENAIARSPENGRFHDDARRFEVATSCTPLFAGLDQSLRLLESEGTSEERLERIRARSAQLWRGLGAIPGLTPLLMAEPPAGLVSFAVTPGTGAATDAGQTPVDGDLSAHTALGSEASQALVQALGDRGFWLRTLADPPCVRACTHVTTTEAEVNQLLDVLRNLAS